MSMQPFLNGVNTQSRACSRLMSERVTLNRTTVWQSRATLNITSFHQNFFHTEQQLMIMSLICWHLCFEKWVLKKIPESISFHQPFISALNLFFMLIVYSLKVKNGEKWWLQLAPKLLNIRLKGVWWRKTSILRSCTGELYLIIDRLFQSETVWIIISGPKEFTHEGKPWIVPFS